MNVARTIFRRKGYLLTALAAAVLLAASSGTAYAQSVGFVGTSATMGEGASPAANTADPITVEIDVSGLTLSGVGANRTEAFGMLTIEHDADIVYPGQNPARTKETENQRIWVDTTSSALDEDSIDLTVLARADAPHGHLYGVPDMAEGFTLPYDNNGVIRLVIIDPGGDGNWQDDKFTMRLVTTALEEGPIPPSPSPASYIVTVTDKDPQATVSFSESSLSLTEGSATTADYKIKVELTAGIRGVTDDPAAMAELLNMVQFRASPANAIVFEDDTEANNGCTDANDRDVLSLTLGEGIKYAARTFTVDQALGLLTDTASFEVEACGDKSGFRDGTVTFSFVETTLSGMPSGIGDVAAGNSLTVTVQSNEAVPTVQFGTSSLNIDEGSTETVAILADEETGPEVDSVMVSLTGDAVLSLWQDGTMLEANDGNYEVDLMGRANAILTVSADSDRALEDGMTSMATLKIESANGADIGDGDTVSVTVNGSTAVPALPLVGQLLLALFLMAGGARLYRRRQG